MAGRHRGRPCRIVVLLRTSLVLGAFGTVLVLGVVAGGGAAASSPPTLTADPAFDGGHPQALDFPFPSSCSKSTSSYATATAIARQSDGKIVVGGYSVAGTQAQFDVARLNPDGSLDTSFGASGTGYVGIQPTSCGDYELHGLAIQSDGKIVLAGGDGASHVVLVRLNANGTLDTANFGSSGIAEDTSATDTANAVTINGAGDILIAGSAGDIRAYNPNGSTDLSFGTAIPHSTRSGHTASAMTSANGIQLQPDAKVVIAGYTTNGASSHAVVARFTSDGSPDTSFGTGGVADTTPTGGDERAKALTLDGSGILIAGSSSTGTRNLLALLTSSGHLDPSFGTGGRATDPGGVNGTSGLNAVAYIPGNQIVAGGTGGDAASSQHGTELCNYYPNGQLIACEERPLGASYKGTFAATATSLSYGEVVNLAGTDGPITSQEAAKPGSGTGTTGSTGSTGTTGEPCPPDNPPPRCKYDLDVTISEPGVVTPGFPATHIAGSLIIVNHGPTASPPADAEFHALVSVPPPKEGQLKQDLPVFVSSASPACHAREDELRCDVPSLSPGGVVRFAFDASRSTAFFARLNVSTVELHSWVGSPRWYSCEAEAEVRCDNNHATEQTEIASIAAIAKVKQPLKASQLHSINGSASAPGHALDVRPIASAHLTRAGVRRVQIALVRLSGRARAARAGAKCQWLTSARATFKSRKASKGVCSPGGWLLATGTTHWHYDFQRTLPPGNYVVFARATLTNGATDPSFSARQGNEVAFTLTPG